MAKDIEKKQAPSETERNAIQDATDRNNVRPEPVRMVMSEGVGKDWGMDPEHDDEAGWVERVQDVFGSKSVDTVAMGIQHLVDLNNGTAPMRANSANAGLAFVAAVAPENDLEAALAVQMFGAHVSAVRMMIRAEKTEGVEHALAYVNMATKFQRTFTMQMEALAKLRRGGEQVVRHIHVDNRGGQAVIADTLNAGGNGNGNGKVLEQPCDQAADAYVAPVLGSDTFGNGVPMPSDDKRTLSLARRSVARRTKGEP